MNNSIKEKWNRPFDTWTKEEIVGEIIEMLDQIRLDSVGGYPSDYLIKNNWVYQATLDPAKEYYAPMLIADKLDDFIKDHEHWVEEIKYAIYESNEPKA